MNKPEHKYANNDDNYKYAIKLPWILIIGPKLRREFKKEGTRIVFKASANLESILFQNKSKFCQVLILEYISYVVLVNQDILVQQKKYYNGQ